MECVVKKQASQLQDFRTSETYFPSCAQIVKFIQLLFAGKEHLHQPAQGIIRCVSALATVVVALCNVPNFLSHACEPLYFCLVDIHMIQDHLLGKNIIMPS
jgi:hypothetical protein